MVRDRLRQSPPIPDESFLAGEGFAKGSMTPNRPRRGPTPLRQDRPGDREFGRLGRTTMRIASLGGTWCLSRQVARQNKKRSAWSQKCFRHDITAIASLRTPPAGEDQAPRACWCWCADGQSATMGTYLVLAVALGPEDIGSAIVSTAQITTLRVICSEPAARKEPFEARRLLIARAVRGAELSNPFCVGRHR